MRLLIETSLCFSGQTAGRVPADNAGAKHQSSRDRPQRSSALLGRGHPCSSHLVGTRHAAGGP
jgi:hypothetical protein